MFNSDTQTLLNLAVILFFVAWFFITLRIMGVLEEVNKSLKSLNKTESMSEPEEPKKPRIRVR